MTLQERVRKKQEFYSLLYSIALHEDFNHKEKAEKLHDEALKLYYELYPKMKISNENTSNNNPNN